MAATNYTPIQLYYSSSASAAPSAGNLASGELAINITDGKLYYKDNGGIVTVIATKGAGTIGGSTTQIQYNNAGALAGNAAMVFNNSTNVTTLTTLNLTNALGAIYGGTAQSAYAQGDTLYASATNTISKLAIGTVNYILTSTGSVPQWVAPTSIIVQTANNLAGGLAGSVPYQSALDTTTFLAIGATNRVMTSAGSAPQWVTALTGLTGVSSSSITNTSLTANRVVLSTTAGLQADDADLTFDGTTLSAGGYSTVGLSTLVKTVKIGDSSFNGVAVFAAATPAKLYMGTGTVTDVTSAISATNTTGAIASLAITPIAATNTGVTYTNASTLYIAGAPSAGTNITITNPYSLYVAAGAAYFGGAVTVAGTVSLAGVTVTSLTDSGLTSGRVTYAGTAGLLQDSANLTFSGTILTSTGFAGPLNGTVGATTAATGAFTTLSSTLGATIQGLTVGLGAGAVASNTAVGASALAATASGIRNTGLGYVALTALTSGAENTGLGAFSLTGNTTGSYNVAIGSQTLISNTTGANNTALGWNSLASNTTASSNTAVGYQAGYNNTTGTENLFAGFRAGYLATGSYAVCLGNEAGYSNIETTNGNVFVGYYSGRANTSGTAVVAIGAASLLANTTGSYNTAIGRSALTSNTTASNNTAVGYFAAVTTTTGGSNTSIGFQSFLNNTTGADNTAIGRDTLRSNTTADGNLAVGGYALYTNTTGASNSAVGINSLFSTTTGGSNVAVGYGSLQSNTTGSSNVAMGYQAGYGITTGASNVYIGYAAAASAVSVSSEIVVGASITGKGANTAFIGGTSGAYNGANTTTWSVTSDIRIKKNVASLSSGLDVVQALRPVEFDYIENDKHDIGFIAQEYQTVLPAQVVEGSDGMLSLNQNLVPYLVKAMQEQQAIIESLKARLDAANI